MFIQRSYINHQGQRRRVCSYSDNCCCLIHNNLLTRFCLTWTSKGPWQTPHRCVLGLLFLFLYKQGDWSPIQTNEELNWWIWLHQLGTVCGDDWFFFTKNCCSTNILKQQYGIKRINQPNVTQMELKIQTLDANADELSWHYQELIQQGSRTPPRRQDQHHNEDEHNPKGSNGRKSFERIK